MGNNGTKIAFEVCVVTADYNGDSYGPGVNMVMFDDQTRQSPTITLDNLFQNEVDFTLAKFTIDLQPWSKLKVLSYIFNNIKAFGKLHHIEFWRTSDNGLPSKWFLDKVIIRDRRYGLTGEWDYAFFPVHQWIAIDSQYVVHDCESWLPRRDPFPSLRDSEIARRMELFSFFQRAKGLPVEWNIEEIVLELIEQSGLALEYTNEAQWDSLETLGNIYKKYNITEPVVSLALCTFLLSLLGLKSYRHVWTYSFCH
ncbi:unnamed protein product [Protopolystoma xenopodis]|uniref:PLAT domain-containing protein n=1 Tax=Protopolystoma xenopodis TaxID=117903 RepID=A0A448X002_9PLAT|nr:unnamed protein product [Protopolystoma xenopodis]